MGEQELPSGDPAPFPMGSVQAVAARSWRMCLREDPVGLLAIPYLIDFPVFVFLVILSELFAYPDVLRHDPGVLAPVTGVLPIVVFAWVFGQAWMITRADAEAHGRRVGYAETVKAAFSRLWPLGIVWVTVYILQQVGFFLLFLPGIIVGVVASFANQSAVLGPGGLVASLRESRALLEHNGRAFTGMTVYWLVAFLGLGMLVAVVRITLRTLGAGPISFALDLGLFLPLHVAFLVQSACWTLFYRELQARRRVYLASHAPGGHGHGHGHGTPPVEPGIPDVHAHAG